MSLSRTKPARLFAALGDEIRLGLIASLCAKGPLSITELKAGVRVTRQGITKHLRVMERSDSRTARVGDARASGK